MNKIKVLIVDDSAVTRKLLTDALSRSRDIEVVGTALDPYIAVDKIKKLQPDVLTLDIEMPRMDGITFVSKLMIARPMPVIMVSALTDAGASATVKALEAGAMDFILKPQIDDTGAWRTFSDELIEKVVAAAGSKIKRRIAPAAEPAAGMTVDKKFTADVSSRKRRARPPDCAPSRSSPSARPPGAPRSSPRYFRLCRRKCRVSSSCSICRRNSRRRSRTA